MKVEYDEYSKVKYIGICQKFQLAKKRSQSHQNETQNNLFVFFRNQWYIFLNFFLECREDHERYCILRIPF